jgi:hypothetical protein
VQRLSEIYLNTTVITAAAREISMYDDKIAQVNTEHQAKGAQHPQHTSRTPLALLSKLYSDVVGGARDVNGVEM